jgi:IS4 transposase
LKSRVEKEKNGVLVQRNLYLSERAVVDYIRKELHFPGLQQAGVLEKVFSNGTQERWYVLTSLPPEQFSPAEFMAAIRKHWQIENGLHNVKDKILKEDDYQGKSETVVENLCILRNATVSIGNRLCNPLKRALSRTKQAIQIALKPLACLHELQRL